MMVMMIAGATYRSKDQNICNRTEQQQQQQKERKVNACVCVCVCVLISFWLVYQMRARDRALAFISSWSLVITIERIVYSWPQIKFL